MRRIRYGVGTSLDGFIADEKGGTDFLVSDPAYDSAPFFASIDTVLMGRVTYEAAVRQGMRAYPGLQNYVVSRTLNPADYPGVTVLGDGFERVIADLRAATGKDIWLCGGGVLFRTLLEAGLVDTVELGISPTLLGQAGTPLVAVGPLLSRVARLELTRHEVLPTGLLILEYAVRTSKSTGRTKTLNQKQGNRRAKGAPHRSGAGQRGPVSDGDGGPAGRSPPDKEEG
jgi:dihydrofolate reductase